MSPIGIGGLEHISKRPLCADCVAKVGCCRWGGRPFRWRLAGFDPPAL